MLPELNADDKLTNAERKIERIRAEMQLDDALTQVERAADMLLFSARAPGMPNEWPPLIHASMG
jgi:hypothetical protein